ncbi:Zinc finger, ZZ type protein [Ceratobasidium sp. AG-Ba]|nr:Zinc finger, ZZ type protein [Ceratobasidium sp. AG-Ba]
MERDGAPRPTSFYSQASTSSCCSVDEGRREVRNLMDSFIADLQRTVRDNFSDNANPSHTPAAPSATRSALFDTDVEVTQPVPGAYASDSAPGSAPPAEEYVHKGIWCDSCSKQVVGIRHKCLDCYDFDLCNTCMTTRDIQSTHADMPHTFQAIHPPSANSPQTSTTANPSSETLVNNDAAQCLCSVLPRPLGCYICKPRGVKNKRSTRVLTYKCDSCQAKITGTRHKCMTCPDFDLCDSCYISGFPISEHTPMHRFMHIEDPIRIITAPAVRHASTSPLCAQCNHDGPRYKCDSCGAVDACTTCLGDVERATIQHAGFHVEQGWDHPVRFTPYTREHQAPAAPPDSTRPARAVHPANCDACDETIIGVRHKCIVCHDFDLCDSCHNARVEPLEHKADHEMLHLDRPMRVVTHFVGTDANKPSTAVPLSVTNAPSTTPNPVHRAWCDGCSERIRGVRHKCLDCEDFDFCDNCVGKDHFDGQHEFYAIVQPGEVIVRNVDAPQVGRVRTRGRPDANVNRPSNRPTPPVTTPVPTRAARMSRPSHPSRPMQPAQHSAACDLCSSRIVGVRYKCVACPDYDVCQRCFSITEEVHPGHSFAMVHKQGDIVVRGSAQSLFRHHARCDVCQKQIMGVRYKCIHPSCPDFDICERCEALPIPIHPKTHAFVKLRSHIGDYDGLKTVFSFAGRGQIPQPEAVATPIPLAPGFIRIQPMSDSAPGTEPATATEMFHTASPSPIVPLSTLGCTIVPHTTIVPSLPQSPAPLSPAVIPSPPPIPSPLLAQAQAMERSLTESWTAASSSAKLDEHVSHHSSMYKPSYEAPASALPPVEAQPVTTPDSAWRSQEIENRLAAIREIRDAHARHQNSQARSESELLVASPSVVHSVTVAEEHDPEAPQMTLMTNSRPVSFPSVPAHEPEVMSEPEVIATPEPVAIAESVMSEPVAVAESVVSEPEVVVPEVAMSEAISTPERIPSPLMSLPGLPALISGFPELSPRPVDLPLLVPLSVAAERPREVPESRASTPVSSMSIISAPSDAVILSAAFVEDRSIVDGQIVSGGAEFAKCWRMRNDGLVAWPKGTTISFVGGHSMLIESDLVHWTITGDFTPGKEIDVEVEMKAPEEPGRYVSYWRLKTPEGEAFGARIWCDIVVAEMERAGSSGSSEVAASSIIIPHAPSMSAASASPTMHSLPSTIAPSVVDTADVESIGSVESDDSLIWEEVRQAELARLAARSEGGDGFEVIYESE